MNPWWKIGLILTWSVTCLTCGWKANTIWQQAHQERIAAAETAAAQRGESAIINFNQQWSIAREADKSPCMLPLAAGKLLK